MWRCGCRNSSRFRATPSSASPSAHAPISTRPTGRRSSTATPRARSYGHDLENIWLLVDALEALGQSAAPLRDLFTQLFAYSLANGYDAVNGGFYDSGPLGQPADRRDKVWWVQAEALVSALTMYRLTGDSKYAQVYLKTWEFTNTKQTDWTTGEWHPTVTR